MKSKEFWDSLEWLDIIHYENHGDKFASFYEIFYGNGKLYVRYESENLSAWSGKEVYQYVDSFSKKINYHL